MKHCEETTNWQGAKKQFGDWMRAVGSLRVGKASHGPLAARTRPRRIWELAAWQIVHHLTLQVCLTQEATSPLRPKLERKCQPEANTIGHGPPNSAQPRKKVNLKKVARQKAQNDSQAHDTKMHTSVVEVGSKRRAESNDPLDGTRAIHGSGRVCFEPNSDSTRRHWVKGGGTQNRPPKKLVESVLGEGFGRIFLQLYSGSGCSGFGDANPPLDPPASVFENENPPLTDWTFDSSRNRTGTGRFGQVNRLRLGLDSPRWNCRGLGNPRTIQVLRDFMQHWNPTTVFLAETKLNKKEAEKRRRLMSHLNCLFVLSIGQSGGLAMIWKMDIKLDIVTYGPHHINSIVTETNSGFRWRITGFYGHPDTHKRNDSWKLLTSLHHRFQLP
ncbi:hypothetical protein SO802_021563 [Lithocarpus litseifolius]|uniref:Uncharacterized protein n=1 Tax=Lithocarpus litseifolius TaxID=425828 RepID=A0AAW2CH66_9ROSI